MKTKYADLKGLRKAIDNGDIDGEKLQIVLDNDQTSYYYYNDGSEGGKEITVVSAGNGYYDYRELYEVYFPSSTVQSC